MPASISGRRAKKISMPGMTNFFRVTKNLYRSAQPAPSAFPALADMGIRTIINLRSFHWENRAVKKAGMKYLHLYVKGWHPEEKEVVSFLKTATDAGSTPVLVHCQHGADRTGVMVAMYRMAVQKWTKKEAISEMTGGDYGFHPFWRNLIKYVKKADLNHLRRKAGLIKRKKRTGK